MYMHILGGIRVSVHIGGLCSHQLPLFAHLPPRKNVVDLRAAKLEFVKNA